MGDITLHWAVNRERSRRGAHPLGRELVNENGTVRCLLASHPFMVASACRREHGNWHNRIHVAHVRYIGTNKRGTLEYGVAACGSALIDPLYVDEPDRDCGCENGATLCPRCVAVVWRRGTEVL